MTEEEYDYCSDQIDEYDALLLSRYVDGKLAFEKCARQRAKLTEWQEKLSRKREDVSE